MIPRAEDSHLLVRVIRQLKPHQHATGNATMQASTPLVGLAGIT